MGKIIAIGGGSIKKGETLLFDQEIIRLSGKKNPRVLFIPTASTDDRDYIAAFQNHYESKLHAIVDLLLLYSENYTASKLEQKIFSADVIYVGGGNTLKMMKLWRKKGIDTLLKKAYETNVVMSGVSAGAICWFTYGHSDSRRYTNPDNWKPIKVKGLDLYPFLLCPHYHAEKREESFDKMVLRSREIGIALDNNTAIEINDDKFRILRSKKSAKAYMLFNSRGNLISEELVNDNYTHLKNSPSSA